MNIYLESYPIVSKILCLSTSSFCKGKFAPINHKILEIKLAGMMRKLNLQEIC